MKKFRDNIVDSIVTDPPYGIKFMSKKWDYEIPSVGIWQEALRVLKPGGHMLCACGTKTQHRMVCNIEDAGFEIRDVVSWVYGSGFPKSLDVGKAIDKRSKRNQEVIALKKQIGKYLKYKRGNRPQKDIAVHFPSKTGNLTGCVANWELGLNLPTGAIWEKLKNILAIDNRYDYLIKDRPADYIEAKREVIGKKQGTVPVKLMPTTYDGKRKHLNITAAATEEAKQWDGWGIALKPACEFFTLARKPLSEKNIAENVLKWGAGGINIDGCRVGNES